MNKDLLKNNYLIVKNLIDSNLAKDISDYIKSKDLPPCEQVPNSNYCINEIPFLEVLCMECPKISNIVKSTLLPTYAFARLYQKGNILKKHTDRSACEVSVTVHLDGDTSWPIWITTPDGKDVSVDLQSGDGMIYLGCIAPHWRTEYRGKEYTQVFLHYVRSTGLYNKCFFDKERFDQQTHERLKTQLVKDYRNLL